MSSKILRNPRLLSPTFTCSTIAEINWKQLKESGLKTIIFDKDNTLTAPYSEEIHERVSFSLGECKDIFGRENLAVISNSAGSSDDRNRNQLKDLEDKLRMRIINHGSKKPSRKCFEAIMEHTEHRFKPNEIVIVGDRLLTDVVFANMFGFFSIYCYQPLTIENDNKVAVALRSIENLIFRKFLRQKD